MDSNTYRHWYDDEVRALLKIWCDAKTQRLLQRRCRNKDVYGMISDKLRSLGYQRDWTQCRVKIKNLKYEYRAARDGTLRGGPSQMARCMRFFNEIDKVLSPGDSLSREGERPHAVLLQTSSPVDHRLPEIKTEAMDVPEVEIIEDGDNSRATDDEEFSDPGFITEETEGDSASSSAANFLLMAMAASSGHSETPTLSVPTTCQKAVDYAAAVPGPSQETADRDGPQHTDKKDGDDPASLHPGPSETSPEYEGVPEPGRKRLRNGGVYRTLERIAGMFLQHERLSEEKYYRWEAQQRQLERLHELRLVSTIIQGFQSINGPPTSSSSSSAVNNGPKATDTNSQ